MNLKIEPATFAYRASGLSTVNLKEVNKGPNFTAKNDKIGKLNAQAPYSNIEKSIIATDKTPLGANYNDKTGEIDFKLASKNATAAFLFVYDSPKDVKPKAFKRMERDENGYWSTSLALEKNTPVYYGYRVFGPNFEYTEDFFDENGEIKNPKAGFKSVVDENGARFNPNKLAFDPYSKEISHVPSDNKTGKDLVYFSSQNYFENNEDYAPKSVFAPLEDVAIKKSPSRRLIDEVIGEVHVKDLSINEDVEHKGTYLGAAEMAKKISKTGVTMVEFLPITEFDEHEGAGNHWGYMPLVQFAPAKKYSSDKTPGGPVREFRQMTDAFHKEGLKVCLDLVFNHTGEGGIRNNDPNDARELSYALIDNQTYYKQSGGIYNENSGCGNVMNAANSDVANLIADSVAFWAKQGVDAFRFDLAAALMDTDESEKVKYDDENSLAAHLAGMLKERGIKVNAPDEKGEGVYLIAEPWMSRGEDKYRLGHFPKNWAEWNKDARNMMNLDSTFPYKVPPIEIRKILEGSKEVFNGKGRSINYSHSHDGYCLYDSNTLNSPEGAKYYATDYDGDKEKQLRAIKKQVALVMLSKGTPMIQIGDIIGHTKGGNANSYNLDDKTNHLDFSKKENKGSYEEIIYDFSTKMIDFRKNHKCLRDLGSRPKYYTLNGNPAPEINDPFWTDPESNAVCYKIGVKRPVYVSILSGDNDKIVKLPKNTEGTSWRPVCDTAEKYSFELEEKGVSQYYQRANSVVIFEEVPCAYVKLEKPKKIKQQSAYLTIFNNFPSQSETSRRLSL